MSSIWLPNLSKRENVILRMDGYLSFVLNGKSTYVCFAARRSVHRGFWSRVPPFSLPIVTAQMFTLFWSFLQNFKSFTLSVVFSGVINNHKSIKEHTWYSVAKIFFSFELLIFSLLNQNPTYFTRRAASKSPTLLV